MKPDLQMDGKRKFTFVGQPVNKSLTLTFVHIASNKVEYDAIFTK